MDHLLVHKGAFLSTLRISSSLFLFSDGHRPVLAQHAVLSPVALTASAAALSLLDLPLLVLRVLLLNLTRPLATLAR